jgi:predicted nucleic acid-binding protein
LKKYLIDTNIAIFYMKGRFGLEVKFDKATQDNCFISEMTLAELKFGVEKSASREKNSVGQLFNRRANTTHFPFIRLIRKGKSKTTKSRHTSR